MSHGTIISRSSSSNTRIWLLFSASLLISNLITHYVTKYIITKSEASANNRGISAASGSSSDHALASSSGSLSRERDVLTSSSSQLTSSHHSNKSNSILLEAKHSGSDGSVDSREQYYEEIIMNLRQRISELSEELRDRDQHDAEHHILQNEQLEKAQGTIMDLKSQNAKLEEKLEDLRRDYDFLRMSKSTDIINPIHSRD